MNPSRPATMNRLASLPRQLVAIAARAELARRSFLEFCKQGWHVLEPNGRPLLRNRGTDALIEHLQAVGDGRIKRLGIAIAPGFGKSTFASVAFPAWMWTRTPSWRPICASHAHSLAIHIAGRARRVIESDWYRESFDVRLTGERTDAFENQFGGKRFSMGVGGALTGIRGDGGIIDDAINAIDAYSDHVLRATGDWYDQAFSNRFDRGDEAAIVVIGQRLAEEDLLGRLFERGGFEKLVLPSEFERAHRCATSIWRDDREAEGELLAPAIHSAAHLAEQKRVQGARGYASQYQQLPMPRGGTMFQGKHFRIIDHAPTTGRWVRRWDLAASTDASSAYTVGGKVGLVDGRIVVADIRRGQWSAWERDEKILATARVDGPSVVVWMPQDPGQAGKSQKPHFAKLLHGFDVRFEIERGDKAVRAGPYSSKVEAELVDLVRAPWNRAFIDEHEAFPGGKFKDQVDVMSGAYGALIGNAAPSPVIAPLVFDASDSDDDRFDPYERDA